MAIKKTRSAYILVPARQWFSRAGVVTLLTLAIILLMMSKAGNPAIARLRDGIMDAATPVLSVTSSPLDAIHDAGVWFSDMAALRRQNIALKNQNIELLQWQAAAKNMEVENQSLRALLHVVPPHKHSFITARIVSDLSGPYVRGALINGGKSDGIRKDEAVINENGLIGRVIETGEHSGRVLLLSDINSRVPVMGERTHERSILSGNNSDQPVLSYLAAGSKIEVGERLVTSGDGGVFPAGVPVGAVTAIDHGAVVVQPFADAANAEYVSIVDDAF